MRLKWKIGLGIFAVTVLVTVINVIIISSLVMPWFRDLDLQAAEENGARAWEYLDAETAGLRSVTRVWAQWDDTYAFATNLSRSYRGSNLNPQDFETLGIDYFVVTDDAGVITFSKSTDPKIAAIFPMGRSVPKGMFTQLGPDRDQAVSAEGVVASPLGPMLVSIAPILNSEREGPRRGYLIFSRLLAPRLDARLREKAHLDADLVPVGELAQPVSSSSAATSEPALIDSDDLTESYTVHDVTGAPSYALQVHTERRFEGIGKIGLNGAIVRFFWLSAVFLVLIAWLIGRLVTKPLAEMANKMSRIAETGDLDHRLEVDRTDEIGWVADVFNRMIGELKAARGRLIEQSYSTGMADLAAGILNNVRHALNPVAEANRTAAGLIEKMGSSNLTEACRELAFTTVDRDRRQKLGAYITAYAEGTRVRLGDVKRQIDRIEQSTNHIRNILEDHESITRWPPQSTPIDCRRLIEEAARGIASTDDLPIDVDVSTGSPDLPLASGHSFILRQVIGNLLANSVNAVERAQRKRGRIHILARKAESAGMPAVEIVVGDNGAGFTAMQSDRLFERGYSTRSDRPGGFGLHWCRDALAAMNATIVGQSPGPGLGATFRVFLPVAKAETGSAEQQRLEGAA
jgi:sensor domain CHASE-containing protein